MVKWLIAACLALTMVLVSLDNWMHGTMFGEKINDLKLAPTRRLHRLKRAASVFHGVLAKFQKLQTCCPVPSLISGTVTNSCAKSRQVLVTKSRNGLFGAWQEISNVRDKTDDSTYACYTECVFMYHGFVSNSTLAPSLKIENITSFFIDRAPLKWNSTVVNAASTCDAAMNAQSPGGRFILSPNGKLCSSLPLKFMICMRKNMILNCPVPERTTACRVNVNALRKANLIL